MKNGGFSNCDSHFCLTHRLNEININVFIEKYFTKIRAKFIKPHIAFIPQNKFILHKRDNYCLISKIYKFESLESEYVSIINDIKIKNPEFNPLKKNLPSLNRTNYSVAKKTILMTYQKKISRELRIFII